MGKLTQIEQIIEAITKLGGKGTIQEILSILDTSQWRTETHYNTITSLLSKYKNEKFMKVGDYWTYIEDSTYLHCSDGIMVTALAKKSSGKWTIYPKFPIKI